MKARDVLIRPLLTEKTALMQELDNTIAFEVAPGANKIQVRRAVEELFGATVEEVRILNRLGKPKKRWGRTIGRAAATRKAYVRLAMNSTVPDFFEGV